MLAIIKEARDDRQADLDRPLVECPYCGERLDFNKDGVADCPLGHFRSRLTSQDRAEGGG